MGIWNIYTNAARMLLAQFTEMLSGVSFAANSSRNEPVNRFKLHFIKMTQQSVHVKHITSKHPAFPNLSIALPNLPLSPSIMCWAVSRLIAGSLLKAWTPPGIYLPPDSHSKRRANKESHQWPRACWRQVSPLVTVSGFPLCWKTLFS